MYRQGRGVEKNEYLALCWYQKAKTSGSKEAADALRRHEEITAQADRISQELYLDLSPTFDWHPGSRPFQYSS